MQSPDLGTGDQTSSKLSKFEQKGGHNFSLPGSNRGASSACDASKTDLAVIRFPACSEPKFASVHPARRSDYEFCLQQLRQNDYGNYLINLLHADRESRCAHASLFAFSVQLARIKDAVTNEDMGRLRLSFFRDALYSVYQGREVGAQAPIPVQSPTLRALRETIQRFSLPLEPFDLLLAARESDLQYPQPDTLQELLNYSQSAHGSCIALHARVLLSLRGAPVAQEAIEAIDHFATRIGTAAGLAILLRGVPHHAARLQTYVPRDIMKTCNISVKELISQRVSPGSNRQKAFQAIAEIAEDHLRRARDERALWRCVPRHCRLAFLPAVLASAYLRRLRLHGYDAYDRRLQFPHTPGTQLKLLWNRVFGSLP